VNGIGIGWLERDEFSFTPEMDFGLDARFQGNDKKSG
jgi:hypothetical protein